MECQRRVKLLVVLTLLQLCRAEIKDTQPQWYSANVINDGFEPKPISEIFATDAAFSTANPIIVSSIKDDDIPLLSTLAPPTSLPSSTTFKTSTTTFPLSQSSQLSSFPPSLSPLPQYSTSQPAIQYIPRMNQGQQLYQQNQPIEIQQQTFPADFETMQPVIKLVSELPQRNMQIQQEQSTSAQNLPRNPPVIQFTTFDQTQQTQTTMPQDVQFEVVSQNGQISVGPQSSTARPPQTVPPQPNYFFIYQQEPQSIQSSQSPFTPPRTTVQEASFTNSAPPITSTLSPTFSSPSPTFSTISSFPMPMRTSPLLSSTTPPPIPPPSTSPQVTVTSLSTFGSSSIASNTGGNRIVNCMLPRSTTPLPTLTNRPVALPINQLIPIRIRVKAPSGSITNVNFNPPAKPQIVPIPIQKVTTTRKPTTRRTPKPRKNTYERCLQGCRKNGQSLCAAPLLQFPVDPKTLRGFPSVCHMACHNSYRKNAYEKVVDGSCGRLRTRIRPMDSNSKLKREELQKVQYFLDNSEEKAILEFTGAYS